MTDRRDLTVIIYDPPPRARELFDRAYEQEIPYGVAMEEACRIAAAEELRRLANESPEAIAVAIGKLCARANELDPEGGA